MTRYTQRAGESAGNLFASSVQKAEANSQENQQLSSKDYTESLAKNTNSRLHLTLHRHNNDIQQLLPFFLVIFRFCTKWENIHFAAWRTTEKGGVGGVVSWSSKQKYGVRVSPSPTIGNERGIPLSAEALRVGRASENSAGARLSRLLFYDRWTTVHTATATPAVGLFGLNKSTGQDDGTATTTKSHNLYAIKPGRSTG
jgi:hypothetical protein